jgi:hypothetical protein
LGRNNQQVTRVSEKLDVQIPQPSRKTYSDQVFFARNSDLYDVHFPNPQGDTTKNKNRPKGLPVVRSGNKEKMGPGGLGEGL